MWAYGAVLIQSTTKYQGLFCFLQTKKTFFKYKYKLTKLEFSIVRAVTLLWVRECGLSQCHPFKSLDGTCRCLGTKPGPQSQGFLGSSLYSVLDKGPYCLMMWQQLAAPWYRQECGEWALCVKTVLTLRCLCIRVAQLPLGAKPSAPCSQNTSKRRINTSYV